MAHIVRDTDRGGSVELVHQDQAILLVRYQGPISLEFVERTAGAITDQIEAGIRRILYLVEESTPLFSPSDLTDIVREVGRAGNREARFAYLAPEDMFARHFMLIEAAAFNEGLMVKFFSDEAVARRWLSGED